MSDFVWHTEVCSKIAKHIMHHNQMVAAGKAKRW